MGRQNHEHYPRTYFQKVVNTTVKNYVSINGLIFFSRNKITTEFPNISEYVPYFASIHREAEGRMNTCPRRYISFLQSFSVLLLNKQQSINKRMAHLNVMYSLIT